MTLYEVLEQEKQPMASTKLEELSPVGGGWGFPVKGHGGPLKGG